MAKGSSGSGASNSGKHEDKTDHNGHKQGGGTGKYGNPDTGGKHSGGKK